MSELEHITKEEQPSAAGAVLDNVCGKKPEVKIITKKPITATQEELDGNSRSKCAKLRIAERI